MEIDKDLPFETLLQLEQKLGSKTFQAYSFSTSKKQEPCRRSKSSDDEAPVECSSKHPPKRLTGAFIPPRERPVRSVDPRFSSRSGTFKEKHFRKNFQHAFDLKEKELNDLKQSTKNDDPEEAEKAKYLIQRMENQKRAYNQKMKKLQPTKKNGTKYFPSKKEILAKEMVGKFEELKDAGKLQSHLEKRRKKQAGKERKKMNIDKS